jgi:AraC-like DNA-binding protein
MTPAAAAALTVLKHPYGDEDRVPIQAGRRALREAGRGPGSLLVWRLHNGPTAQDTEIVRGRPGGLPLVVILPEDPAHLSNPGFLHALESVRPLGILPGQPEPAIADLLAVLRRPPEDLAAEVTDYLAWRGIPVDRETGRLIRKTIALSAELRSISALSRSLYLSRRALGRRFMNRGIPVPSHWLQFGRLLRVTIRLQNSDDSVLAVGYELGYPDGFSLSNQMVRLTGYRPVDVREYLGWEWLLESWLRCEADTGGLAPDLTEEILTAPTPRPVAPRPLPNRRADEAKRKAVG